MGIMLTLTRKTSEVFFLNREIFPLVKAVLSKRTVFLCDKREYLLLVISIYPRNTIITYLKGI